MYGIRKELSHFLGYLNLWNWWSLIHSVEANLALSIVNDGKNRPILQGEATESGPEGLSGSDLPHEDGRERTRTGKVYNIERKGKTTPREERLRIKTEG